MSRTFTDEEWIEIRRAAMAKIGDHSIGSDLPTVLLTYQQRTDALMETASVIVIEKSRRIGLTWGLASSAVLKSARGREAGGMDVLYISYARDMTREFVDACGMWARAFAMAAAEEEEFLFDDTSPDDPTDTRQIQAFRIKFASGFEVIALSSAPRSLRGKQGLCIIDEAAFVDSLKELVKAALAFLMWGGQVVIVSTHNGAGNYFNELIQEIHAGTLPYAHLKIDLDDALRDGLYQRICLVRGKEWSPEAEAEWRRDLIKSYKDGADEELFCVPKDSDGVWLSTTMIEARMTEDAQPLRFDLPSDFLLRPKAEQRGMIEAHYLRLDAALERLDKSELHGVGHDVARYIDLAATHILSVTRTLRRRSRILLELRRWPYQEQANLLIHIARRLPRFQAVAIDATGSGDAVAEGVARTIGAQRVAAIKLSREWYRTNMPHVRLDIDEGTLSLIRDREHRDDLRAVELIQGVPMVPDVRRNDGTGGKRHGDTAISLALAHAVLREPPRIYESQSTSELEEDGLFASAGLDGGDWGERGLW